MKQGVEKCPCVLADPFSARAQESGNEASITLIYISNVVMLA